MAKKKFKNSIFQEDGRIERYNEGIRFFEQDIVMLDYIYSGDFVLDATFNYRAPGFGFAIFKYSELETISDEPANGLIAKFGSYDFSVYCKDYRGLERINFFSTPLTPDSKDHRIKIQKSGLYYYIYSVSEDSTENLLNSFSLRESQNYERFRIGIYSNAGNIIKELDIYDNRPTFWFTNIQNTNGGRIEFRRDLFSIDRAEVAAEVERELIKLEPGKYYLNFNIEDTAGDRNNIKYYLYDSTEDRIHASEKNLLNADNSFELKEPKIVNLLFQGYTGTVRNIAIKEDPNQGYVSTDGGTKSRDASSITFNLEKLQKIEWTGIIEYAEPFELNEEPNYSIISYGSHSPMALRNLKIKENIKYNFVFERAENTNGWKIEITEIEKERVTFSQIWADEDSLLTIFRNINGVIDSLIVTTLEGQEINVIFQKTMKKYVSADIESPILIVNKDNEPLDISATYRVTSDGEYVFTNWEREIFNPDSFLTLSYPALEVGSVIIRGIKKAEDESRIYDIQDKNSVNQIELYSTAYDDIASDLYDLSDSTTIELDVKVLDKGYDHFVVDYLKNDSYAINYLRESNQYEVDISTNQDEVFMLYDMSESGQVSIYKPLENFEIVDDRYIVLRKAEVLTE